jgi:glycosidase
MEIALDFAINCSPDHPYVRDHPEWFFKRPDGTIKYAENPPKKYQDVYPLNFHNPTWQELWKELYNVVAFWCERGVRIFRVDNPHTKPVSFWEWLIAEIHEKYQDAQFLSEAFTRPKMMAVLAKAGFTQSYTYFTKYEVGAFHLPTITQTRNEIFSGTVFREYAGYLATFLQLGGRPPFLSPPRQRPTLSPVWNWRVRALRHPVRAKEYLGFRPHLGTQLGCARNIKVNRQLSAIRQSRAFRVDIFAFITRKTTASSLQQDDHGQGQPVLRRHRRSASGRRLCMCRWRMRIRSHGGLSGQISSPARRFPLDGSGTLFP